MQKLELWFKDLTQGLLALFDSRVLLLLVPALTFLYWKDAAVADTIVYAFVVMIAMSALSHLMRKMIFPYIDLKQFVDQAKTNPIASGQVVVAMAMIICTLIYATVQWIRA